MIGPKYGFTGKNKKINGEKVYEIIALKNFGMVRDGEIGGWLTSEKNLSQDGACWVGKKCAAIDDAIVTGSAIITGDNIVLKESAYAGDNTYIQATNLIITGLCRFYDAAVFKAKGGVAASISNIDGCDVFQCQNIEVGAIRIEGRSIVNFSGDFGAQQLMVKGSSVVSGETTVRHRFEDYSNGEFIFNENPFVQKI